MRSVVIGFAAGVCCLQMQADLPGRWSLLALCVLMLLLMVAGRWTSRPTLKLPMLFIIGTLAGFGWATSFAHWYLADMLPKELEGQNILVTGTVRSLPFQFADGERFNFAVESAQVDGIPVDTVPHKIALSWYAGSHGDGAPLADVKPGERWQLLVHLQRPHGNANVGSFDYEAWLLEQGIRATGTVSTSTAACASSADRGVPCAENHRIAPFVWSVNNVIERSRGWLRDRILTALPDKKYAGVIVALVIGDERGVGQSDWKTFNRTGVGHLIAI